MKKVCLYARVSTSDKWQDVLTQLLPLREYAQRNGREVTKEYVDQISWGKEQRPGLDDLMKAARLKEFDVVLVRRFDRMSRSTTHLISTLELLRRLNIDFVSHQENIDTSTPTGKLMFTIIGAFWEFEKSILRSRVKAWMEKAKQLWKKIWREKQFTDYERVFELRNKGFSMRTIAKDVWVSPALIHSILSVQKTSQNSACSQNKSLLNTENI